MEGKGGEKRRGEDMGGKKKEDRNIIPHHYVKVPSPSRLCSMDCISVSSVSLSLSLFSIL